MPPFAQTALAIAIVLSAVGAIVVCLLTILYGFTPEDEQTISRANRRKLLTRVGHAVAAVCFAGTAVLLGVVLAEVARWTPSPSADARVPALDSKVNAQSERLQGVEQRMKDSEQALERLETEVSEATARHTAAESPAVIVPPSPNEVTAAPARKAAPRPRPAAAHATPVAPARVAPSASPPSPPAARTPVERPAASVAPQSTSPAASAERSAAVAAPPPPVSAPTPTERPTVIVTPPPPTSPNLSSPSERAVAPPTTDDPGASPGSTPSSPPISHRAPSSTPRPSAPASHTDFLTKLRNDWREIQRSWQNAGDDFRRAIAPLRGE